MLIWLKRLFLGDERLFLYGSHLERVIRDNDFHGVEDVGEVGIPNLCHLVLNYERDGNMTIYIDEEVAYAFRGSLMLAEVRRDMGCISNN